MNSYVFYFINFSECRAFFYDFIVNVVPFLSVKKSNQGKDYSQDFITLYLVSF